MEGKGIEKANEDLERALDILYRIHIYISDQQDFGERYLIMLKMLSNKIRHGDRSARRIVLEELYPYYEIFSGYETGQMRLFPNSFNEQLKDAIKQIEYDLNHGADDTGEDMYAEYYRDRIDELEKKAQKLKAELDDNKNQTLEQSQEKEEVAAALEKVKQELIQNKAELEEKKKQEKAQGAWSAKIIKTFEGLKDYLEPIKKEKKRLEILYTAYIVLSCIALVSIIVIEINAVCKLSSRSGIPSFEEYLILFTPLPVAGFLMWGFISQMNRAQRQLMVIAHKIHSIDYIQGLLLAINKLSPDINETIPRINKAIDKIISNHLDSESLYSEEEIQQEEHKDQSMDLDRLIKLLKAVKETTV